MVISGGLRYFKLNSNKIQPTMNNRKPLFKFVLSTIFIGSLLLIAACSDDDPEGPSLEGDYTFVSATLRKDITIDGNTITAGTDISAEIKEGLFGAVTCADPNNTAIRLADGGTLYFICVGETAVDPLQAGTWSGTNNNTNLVLALSSPPFPSPISATVKGLELDGDELSGYIQNLPIPGASFGDPGTAFVLTDFDIVFEKQ